jgi:hypothetical protein
MAGMLVCIILPERLERLATPPALALSPSPQF